MNMKKKILRQLKKGSLSCEALAQLFQKETASDFVVFNKALNELEDNREIIIYNDMVYLPSKSFFKGIVRVNDRGVGFLIEHPNHPPIYHLNGAIHLDEVLVENGRVIKIVKRRSRYLVGEIFYRRKKMYARLDNKRYHYLKLELEKVNFRFSMHDKIVFMVESVTSHGVMYLRAVRVLGKKRNPDVQIDAICIENDLQLEFPKIVLKEEKKIPQTVSHKMKEHRLDLTELPIVTIDGNDSKDFDDAVYVKKHEDYYELIVAIADVAHYVKPYSSIDKEAARRGTSVYLVDRVIPMLPFGLSNGICSLNPGVERLTLSVHMQINFSGEVIYTNIFESVIRSHYRLTYDVVNEIYEGNQERQDEYAPIVEMLMDMEALAKAIRYRRQKMGMIDFDVEEPHVIIHPKTKKVVTIGVRTRKISERVIEDFMICCNEEVAKMMKESDIPCLYRVHEPMTHESLENFNLIARQMRKSLKVSGSEIHPKDIQFYLKNIENSKCYDILSSYLLRSMQKARYDSRPLGHFGLALPDYLHFTSPIRRYPDLQVHRMIKKYLIYENHKDPTRDIAYVETLQSKCSESERIATDVERKVVALKMAEYMKKYVDKVFEGKIVSITHFGFFVQLDNLVNGLVHIKTLTSDHFVFDSKKIQLVGSKQVFKLNQKVKVKVKNVTDQVDFVLWEE